jgi:hypothetical protein
MGKLVAGDGMVQYSINDISKRTQIANTMEGLVDSALVTRPRAGGGNFRIATVTAFFLRDLRPPPEALTKQWIEVLHDMKGSSNLIIFVPTEGGLPLLNIGDLRKNLKP